jgi:hypothetical protein
MVGALALATLVLIVAALPGVVFARARGARLAGGACLSLGAHAALLSFFPAVAGWVLLVFDLAFTVFVLLAGGDGRRRSPKAHPLRRLARRIRRRALPAVAVLSVFASFSVLAVRHGSPRGWDPTFHVLLVEKLASGERPTTWEPWEPVSVHYTLGADALVAHVAKTAGLRPHEAFLACFPFAYALAAWSALGALERATKSRLAALYGTVALFFLGLEVRLMYHWGGLPTVLGIALGLAAVEAETATEAGLLLGSLAYLHHLSALIAWSTALVLAFALRKRAIARALAVAAVVSLPLVPTILQAAGETGTTSILRFGDEPVRTLAQYVWGARNWGWGPILVLLAGLGLARRKRPRGALVALVFLVSVHVLLDVVYRFGARALRHEDVTALTPSRWFQLASVPLAAFAGLGACVVFPRRRYALLGMVAIAVASIPFDQWEYMAATRSIDSQLFLVGDWVREKVPEDALVVVLARDRGNQDPALLPDRDWWPYLLDRETDWTPLPASEPRNDPRVLAKRALALDPEAARAYARSRHKALYWLVPFAVPPVAGAQRVDVYHRLVALDRDVE